MPTSSNGHLLIASHVIGFKDNLGGTFEIIIQLGAVLAVILFYAPDLLGQARALPSQPAAWRFWLCIAVAFLPAALIGLLLRGWIKQVLFKSPTVIAWSLILGGVALLLADQIPRRAASDDIEQMSLRQALGVGAAQVFALIPGVSWSGASNRRWLAWRPGSHHGDDVLVLSGDPHARRGHNRGSAG